MVGQILMVQTQIFFNNYFLKMDWTFVRLRAQKGMIDLKTFCRDFLSNFVINNFLGGHKIC